MFTTQNQSSKEDSSLKKLAELFGYESEPKAQTQALTAEEIFNNEFYKDLDQRLDEMFGC